METYELIDSYEKLAELHTYLMKSEEEYLAVDTETNGLNFFKNVVIGVSLATNANKGFYIPFLTWIPNKNISNTTKKNGITYPEGHFKDMWSDATYPENVTPQDYAPPEKIKDYIQRWLEAYKLIMHNAPFDLNMLAYNLEVEVTEQLHCDTSLLKHVIDENDSMALKDIGMQWMGYAVAEDAKKEQRELGESVIRNGGKFNKSSKNVWRGDLEVVAKYAAKDACLTYGIYTKGMEKFQEQYEDKHFKWFYEEEVMPLCKEVVTPMKYGGVYIDVDYFEKLKKETEDLLTSLEDQFISMINPYLDDFPLGKSMESIATRQFLINKLIQMEGLPTPTNKDGKATLNKLIVKKVNDEHPHWLWDYVLGEGEIQYSSKKLETVKKEIYFERTGKRYIFNINSRHHLRWLLFTKLGHDKTKVEQTVAATPKNPIPSVKSEVLKKHFLGKYDFIVPLLKYFKLVKLLNSYILPATTLHHDGWLNLDFRQNGTISGRFSCSGGFNLMTLPRISSFNECPQCESKNVKTKKTFKLLIDLHCDDCGYNETDIIDASGIKAGFIAPPNYDIVNADFSSLEPRCFSFMSQDAGLKEIYKKGLDLYSKIYCDVLDSEGKYSADPADMNFLKSKAPKKRVLVKPVVLGIPYGALAPQVARLMSFYEKRVIRTPMGGFEEIEVLDVNKGEAFRQAYLQAYPKLKAYMEDCELRSVTAGYVETIIGRRRHYKYAPIVYKILSHLSIDKEDFINSKKKYLTQLPISGIQYFCKYFSRDFKEVMALGGWVYIRNLFKNELNNSKNYPIQGLAAHITNKAMLDIQREFRYNDIDGYVCMQVHDEITAYTAKKHSRKAAEIMKRCMENNKYAKLLDIPMEANPIICPSLKDSK